MVFFAATLRGAGTAQLLAADDAAEDDVAGDRCPARK